MEISTKYITKDDYLQYFGDNLDVILPKGDSPNNRAERFIMQVEDEVALFLDTKCFKRIDSIYRNLTDYQKLCYQKALLNQCKYKIDSGDIGNESGFNPESGIIAKRGDLEGIELSSKCVNYLRLAGLYTRQISGGRFFNPFEK